MKHADKNEVDLLLRNLARRGRSTSSANGEDSEVKGEHLDTDELNAYAEDVIPQATRARYTAHIADCSACRSIVSQLALAAGASVRTVETIPFAKASLWERLGAFFSPAVLRYAAPALVLLFAIGIGFIVLRQQRQRDFVAQNSTTRPASEPSNTPRQYLESQSVEKNASVSPEQQTPLSSADEKNKKAPEAPARGVVEDRYKQQPAPADETHAQPTADTSATKTGAAAGAVAQPSYAPEPQVAAAPQLPPPAKPAATKLRDAEEAKQKEKGERSRDEVAQAKRENAQETFKAAERDDRTATRKVENLPRRAELRGQVSKDKKSDADQARTEDESQIRSVAGRRFRRSGDIWIDTGYESSRALTLVKRGSEQYRSLVADEPEIATVANTLKGTVILIWKGRGYRIQ
jgi:Putative zinc-finger